MSQEAIGPQFQSRELAVRVSRHPKSRERRRVYMKCRSEFERGADGALLGGIGGACWYGALAGAR